MPEKKQGVLGIIRSVFKVRKNYNEDIVCQAENVIRQYIAMRKSEIIGNCYKKNKLLNLVLWGLVITISVCVYNLVF